MLGTPCDYTVLIDPSINQYINQLTSNVVCLLATGGVITSGDKGSARTCFRQRSIDNVGMCAADHITSLADPLVAGQVSE